MVTLVLAAQEAMIEELIAPDHEIGMNALATKRGRNALYTI